MIQAPSEIAALTAGPKPAVAPKLLVGTADFSALLEASQSGADKPLIASALSDESLTDVPEARAQAEFAPHEIVDDPVKLPGNAMPESGKVPQVDVAVSSPIEIIAPWDEGAATLAVEPKQSLLRDGPPVSVRVDPSEAQIQQGLPREPSPKVVPAAPQNLSTPTSTTAAVPIARSMPNAVAEQPTPRVARQRVATPPATVALPASTEPVVATPPIIPAARAEIADLEPRPHLVAAQTTPVGNPGGARTLPRPTEIGHPDNRADTEAKPLLTKPTELLDKGENPMPARKLDLAKPAQLAPAIQPSKADLTGEFTQAAQAAPIDKNPGASLAQTLHPDRRGAAQNLRGNVSQLKAPKETAAPQMVHARPAAPNARDLAGLIEQPAKAPSNVPAPVQTYVPQDEPAQSRNLGRTERPVPSNSAPELPQPAQSQSQPSAASSASANPQALQAAAPIAPIASITPSAPAIAEPRANIQAAPQIEAAIDHMVEAREAGRASRPELTLRHAEFGAVNVRLEGAGADLRATLASRDPAFVPAIQAALAERGVVAASETSSANTQRGHDQSSNPSHSNSHFSGGNAHSEGRYGSSTGSGQAQSQPYSEQNGSDDEELVSHDRSEPAETGAETSSGSGLFA